MWSDVVDLRDFYESHLGRVARRLVRRRIRELWPDIHGQTLLGLGYATPYLSLFREEAARVIGVMPAAQGVLHWPRAEPNAVALADEAELPLPDVSIDRVLLVHSLECSEQLRAMLREVWRIMADGGRLLVVVPNRSGIWARLDRTPFGHGYPYTPTQLSRVLRENLFTPIRTERALFVPPGKSRMLMASAPGWEGVGHRLFPTFSGVLLIEARKEIYAASQAREGARARRIYVPASGAGPEPA